MRQGVTIAAMVWSLAAPAAAQWGARVTLPPHSRQSGKFHFANGCGNGQTFKASVDPSANWLHFEPATADVPPGSSSEVQVEVDAGNRALGTYHSTLKVYCATCAASDPPCFQNAMEFALELTVANVAKPSEFALITPPPREEARPSSARSDGDAGRPTPFVPAEPAPQRPSWFVPVVGGGALAVGAVGLVLSLRALWPKRGFGPVDGESAVESERHRVQR
jgi:hypothetical protein